jgi:hypothetical protein
MPVCKQDIILALALTKIINYAPRVVNYTPIVILQIMASLTIVIYDHIIFIEQATGDAL